ncbi:MAG TPA: Ni/Fe hydrogenase subunit alpha [Phototrophicaceae bacterium]|nr:Ni/Fe hydrogenase subunit alpha [Phototrophicaceae bacterium]
MAQRITIDPVTRIEGHAKITIQLNDAGEVADAHFHVTQLRGFEKFCEGRPFHEMPSLMSRICGICPVSHLVASAKACDALLAVRIPPTAQNLRRILNLAQIAQSHALSFFYLSAPDLLLGMDADPARRNLIGVAQTQPQLARDGIRLRQIGQQIIELLGGKRIHPAWVVPGGVSEPLSAEKREQMLTMVQDGYEIALRTLYWYQSSILNYAEEIRAFGAVRTLFMGLTNERDELELYDGFLRLIDAEGQPVADRLAPENYEQFIAERVEPWSYLKSPFYKPLGYPEGIYRVGPLARLNIVKSCGTPRADEALQQFRQLDVQSSFHYHYARLIEILYCFEKIDQLLRTPDILSDRVRAHAEPNTSQGVGVSEAPRGTLIHHYQIDENGLITRANLIIATGHNNYAMDRSVLEVAKRFVQGTQLSEGMLNRVEAVIRAFDPCLSCSTHAVGQMPLQLQLVAPSGEVIDEVKR